MEEKIIHNDKIFTLSEYGLLIQKFCIDNSLPFGKVFKHWALSKNGTPVNLFNNPILRNKFYPYFFPFFKALLFKEIEENGFSAVYATMLLTRVGRFMCLKTTSFDAFIEYSYELGCLTTLINELHSSLIINKNSKDLLSLVKNV